MLVNQAHMGGSFGEDRVVRPNPNLVPSEISQRNLEIAVRRCTGQLEREFRRTNAGDAVRRIEQCFATFHQRVRNNGHRTGRAIEFQRISIRCPSSCLSHRHIGEPQPVRSTDR